MSTKEDSPPLTAANLLLWREATKIFEHPLNSFSDRTINLQRTITNDIQSGVVNTVSITPSDLPLGGGSVTVPSERYLLNPSTGERTPYPDSNPKTAFGAKKIPLEVVPPSAVHALAEAFADGAKKYGPYNWREKTISSSVYYGAALRHLHAWWDGEDVAEDSGIPHLHHALACIAMLVDGKSVGKLNDNRPPKGAASRIQKAWVDGHKNS